MRLERSGVLFLIMSEGIPFAPVDYVRLRMYTMVMKACPQNLSGSSADTNLSSLLRIEFSTVFQSELAVSVRRALCAPRRFSHLDILA
jgi:hypothetical protein